MKWVFISLKQTSGAIVINEKKKLMTCKHIGLALLYLQCIPMSIKHVALVDKSFSFIFLYLSQIEGSSPGVASFITLMSLQVLVFTRAMILKDSVPVSQSE